MIFTTLNFKIYVLGLTKLLNDSNQQCCSFLINCCSLISSPRENCPAITNAIAFANTVLDLPLSCAKLVCFCYQFIFLMLDGSLERKTSKENENTIWKTYN